MDQNSIRAMIVFSDTHLGLAPWKLFWEFGNTVTSRPCHVHQFVRWLLHLENTTTQEVLVGDELGQICPKKLLSPDELVLNGDILELWDANDHVNYIVFILQIFGQYTDGDNVAKCPISFFVTPPFWSAS
jgi:hypothetical protein